jgi:erythrin-vacuolar iron transport family protein
MLLLKSILSFRVGVCPPVKAIRVHAFGGPETLIFEGSLFMDRAVQVVARFCRWEKGFAMLEALHKAIEMEIEGRQFYLDSAAMAKNPSVRQALEYLAQDEQYHAEKFKEIYEELSLISNWTESMATCNFPLQKPITYPKRSDEDTGSRHDLEIMRTVLRLEKNGIDYYTRLAKETDNLLAKTFFSRLAHEEQNHYDKISHLLNFIEVNLAIAD